MDKVQSVQTNSVDRRPDGTIAINITVPAVEVDKVSKSIITELVKEVEIQGFRKGAAPRNLAEKKINPETLKEEILKKVLTDEYIKAVKELDLKPVINPRIHVEQFTEGTDLKFSAETCEEPKTDLKNYKDEVKKVKSTPKIIVPGQEEKPGEAGSSSARLDEILAVVLTGVEITVPKILIDQETDRLLSNLLDELKRLGISLDQYLGSRNKNSEQLRGEYAERAEKDLKLEFILRKIAEEEKITVEEADIKQAIEAIKDDKERTQIAQNPYMVAAIIRQQKTLDFLSKL